MRFFGSTRLFALAGLIAFCALGGDIVADSMSDACCEQCTSQTSQSDSHNEKSPCSSCSCAVHNGSAIASNSAVHIGAALDGSLFFLTIEASAPDPIPPAIDHPPQLA
jgi:hypothetical protein